MRSVCLSCVVSVLLMGMATSASAAPCGVAKTPGEEPTYGTLTLKAEESEPNVSTGRKTGERQMIFVFGVTGCTLPAGEEIGARIRSTDLNVATTFGRAETELEKSLAFVQIPVHPGEFEPGKHTAIVTVEGRNISPSVSKVTLQRSENRWWIPLIVCLIAAVVALAILVGRAYVEANDNGSPELNVGWLLVGCALALVGAALVYKSTYLEPEIWESDFGSMALLFAAAVVAAGGASTLAVVNKVWTPSS